MADFRAACKGTKQPSIKGLLYAGDIRNADLVGHNLFHQGECRRWTLFGNCPCRGQQRHTQLPEDRLRKINEHLAPAFGKYIAYIKRITR